MLRPKILLVADSRAFLEEARDYLREWAIIVYTATSGSMALEFLQTVQPDLVFMALDLPDMEGTTCCAAIKGDSRNESVRVVMVGVVNEQGELARCRRSGCDGMVTLPVSKEVFLSFGHQFLPEVDRVELRVTCNTQVVFKIKERPFYARSVDLSTHGLYIAFSSAVTPDDRISLSFLLPGGEMELIEADGRVAWVNSGDRLVKPPLPPGFGVEFLHIAEEAVARIATFMDRPEVKILGSRIENAYFRIASP
jgi:CheY-like chemotaxis protein